MKIYLKIFRDTKWWMYLPFAAFKLSRWTFEPENYIDREWRFIFCQFNLIIITLPFIVTIFGLLNNHYHILN